jgi:hypothetical protein
MSAALLGGFLYVVDSGPLWPGVALLSVLAAAVTGAFLARRPRDVLALGVGAFAGVALPNAARALEPGAADAADGVGICSRANR